jgi:hypothetical protein
MKLLLSLFLVLSLNANANVFDDIGGWFEGAANDTGDWFEGAYNDVSYFVGHNPGISILGGLAVVSVTEPLALPWVALGTATPFILGYRVVGDKIVISQAPKYITESLAKTEMIEMGMFDMGTGRLLVKDGVGGTAKTVLEQAAEDSAAAAARKLAQGAVTESNEMTVGNFFKSFKEAPGKLLSRFGVGAPEEIEMDSVEVNIFENPHYSFDPPTAPTESASNEIELQRLQNQKLLKYSPSDNFSPELEREIDDMIAKAAYNESQKTFQQMSQKESLTLAKDMIELQSKELGYSGKWLKAAENSVADEMVLADPFFTPDAYLNPKSYPTKIMFSEVTTTTTLSGSAWRITSIGSFTSGAVLGFGYSAYKSITDGIDWTRDATKTIANAANDSYCWLKNGGYMVCDGKWFETISERLVANKTDNKYYYDDSGRIPMDGQLFTLDTDIIKE